MTQKLIRSRHRGTGDDTTPPPNPGDFVTFLGSWNLPENRWGDAPSPDVVQSNSSGAAWVQGGGIIDDLTTAGGQCFAKMYGANTTVMTNPPGDRSFSRQKWTDRFDSWRNGIINTSGGVAKLRTAIRNGVFRALVGFDDFIAAAEDGGASGNAFFPEVTFQDIEFVCEHAKVTRGWGWLPIVGRGPNVGLKTKALDVSPSTKYQFLDAGWMQVRVRLDGPMGTYFNTQIDAGLDVDLGSISGINIAQGAGDTPGVGCIPTGSRCYVSAAEILTVGRAALNRSEICGWSIWTANPTHFDYWNSAAIQGALQTLYNEYVGIVNPRLDGPINVRGDLVDP